MSDNKQLLKQALLAIETLKDRVKKAESKANEREVEPIAIVGMGCRFPGGVTTPKEFWELLAAGKNSITEVPEERWSIEEWYDEDPEAVGKMYARHGGFVDGVDRFDPGFFNISEQEALSIDPQERLMLETCWEALENAGQTKAQLKDSNTGVYFGICGGDYQINVFGDVEKIDAYSALGTAHSAMTGRISYWLGLKGPNMPIDTACSSSLVALHLAVQALRNGECEQALVGGVNLTLDPILTLYFSKLRALSPTGQCQTFSENANGYVRSEGAGSIFLKPLSKAQADGDKVLAVIRGTAVNQDGKSQGFTAPNGPSQQAVIKKALDQAGITPDQIDYIECHGTGTPLGDPIEVQSIGSMLEENRPENRPVILGSVKSNIGHTEGAAGIAGVIKTVLSLQHEEIPQTLHAAQLNSAIDWEELPVQVAQQKLAWKKNGKSRLAGVSSFGFSGTNAHVILEEAPVNKEVVTQDNIVDERPLLFPITATSDEALAGQLHKLQQFIKEDHSSVQDIAYTLATRKTHFSQRLGISVSSKASFLDYEFDAEENTSIKKKTAFLFTGGGAQYVGMGKMLYAQEPVFKAAIDACVQAVAPYFKQNLKDVIFASEASEEVQLLHRIDYMQPALFAYEYAMVQLLESWGVRPQVLIGHSLGEIVAATVAGVFSLADGMKLISLRGKLMNSIKTPGMMASIQATEEEVSAVIGDRTNDVSIGVINGPDQIVISGKIEAVEAICVAFEKKDKKVKRLQISTASHSPLMDNILDDYKKVVNSITFQKPNQVLVSNVKGDIAGDEIQTADYWIDHLRGTVRFSEGIETLEKLGVNTFIEVGPHSVLLGISGQVLNNSEECNFIATAHNEDHEGITAYEGLAKWFSAGGTVDWDAYYKGRARNYVVLPNYAFLRDRYWIDKKTDHFEAIGKPGDYLFSGYELSAPNVSASHFVLPLNKTTIREVYDHIIYEASVIPGAFYISVFLAILQRIQQGSKLAIGDIEFLQALQLTAATKVLHIVVKKQQLECYTESNGQWSLHARATVNANDFESSEAINLAQARQIEGTAITVSELFETMENEVTITFEKQWQWVQSINANAQGTFSRLQAPSSTLVGKAPLHPGFIDNGFIAAMGQLLVNDVNSLDHAFVPVSVGEFKLFQPNWDGELYSEQRFKTIADDQFISDVYFWNAKGELIAECNDLLLRAAPKEVFTQFFNQQPAQSDFIYDLRWNEYHLETTEESTVAWEILQEGTSDLDIQTRLTKAGLSTSEIGEFDLFTMAGSEEAHQIIVNWDAVTQGAADTVSEWLEQAINTLRLLDQPTIKKVVWVTKNAQAFTGAATEMNLLHRALWGLGKSARLEFPNMNLQLVDVASAEDITVLPQVLANEGSIQDWNIREGKLYTQQLEIIEGSVTESIDLKEKTVLITGGLGALGLAIAKHLVEEKEVGQLVLLSRRTPEASVVDYFENTNATVTFASVDITDKSALEATIQNIPDSYPLVGIIHTAGILEDELVHNISPAQIKAVVQPKALGAWYLHELTADLSLDFFVLYSSLASVVGNIGQGVYAAANAYLDGLVAYRKQQGLAATSINWGPWSQIGMAAGLNELSQEELKQSGVHFITEKDGVAAVGQLLGKNATQVVAAQFNTKQIARNAAHGEIPNFFKNIVKETVEVIPVKEKIANNKFLTEFLALPQEERQAFLENEIKQQLTKILGADGAAQITADTSLKEIGLDSLKAVELRNKLAKKCGVKLPVTVLFTTPQVNAIAAYIKEQLEQRKGVEEEKVFTAPSKAQPNEKGLSSMQERLWFMHKLNPESPEYNTYIELNYKGVISLPILHTAFYALIQRHEAFRMYIEEKGGSPEIATMEAYFPMITEVDLSQYTEEEKEVQFTEARRAVQHHVYDFAKPPMVIQLVKWSESFYKVLVGQHHIITDGYSILFFIKELITVYESFAKGQPFDLAPLEASYFDFVRLEQQAIGTSTYKRSLDYWTDQLADVPSLNLPTKKGVTATGYQGEMVHFEVTEDQTVALQEIANKAGVTLNAVVFGIYALLLRRYANQDDFGIGTAVANRTEAEFETIQGFFVNTLVWRCQFEGHQSLFEYFKQVNTTINESIEHQEIPYQHIVDAVSSVTTGGQARNLYNASFTFQGFAVQNMLDPDSLWEPDLRMLDASVEGVTKNDLSMTMALYEGRLLGNLSFRTGMFDGAFIDQFVAHFNGLIQEVIAQPQLNTDELSMLALQEENQLLAWSGKDVVGPSFESSIIRQFEDQVAKSPESVALRFENREWTYSEVDQQANNLAHYLVNTFELNTDDVVGVLLDRSPEAIISILAILKAGAAFLPVDASQPNERIQYIFENAQVKAVVLESDRLFDIQFSTPNLFAIDVQLNDLEVVNGAPDITIDSSALAYVIYTSGSTGKPKGVAVEHHNIAHYIGWANSHYFDNDTKYEFGLFTSLAFDLTLTSIFTTLVRGGQLHIFNASAPINEVLNNVFSVESTINAAKVTPSHISMLKGMNLDHSNIEKVILGGEKLQGDQVRLLQELNANIEIYNEYGPTETTVGCMVHQTQSPEDLSIGKPIPGYEVYILNSDLQLQPVGVWGELCVGGKGVARGYIHNEALTKERFVAHPFNPEARIYKTGDIARWTKEGTVEYSGRIDHQVKVNGYRIELGEIEAALTKCNGVGQAIVLAPALQGTTALCVWYQANEGITSDYVKAQLKQELPDYMVPAYCVRVDRFELTKNGKIDTNRLPNPITTNSTDVYEAPQGDTEIRLVNIWSVILERTASQIGRQDGFFDLGGNSLKAVYLLNQIQQEFQVELSLQSLFDQPSLINMAQAIEQSENVSYTAITPATEAEFYPVSSAQKRLYFLYEFDKTSLAYNTPMALVWEGELSLTKLEQAFRNVIARHEGLRTHFELQDGNPVQRIQSKDIAQSFSIQQLGYINTSEETVRSFVQPFNLNQGPLLRVGIANIAENKHLLLLDMHHIISDGITLNILIREFTAWYQGVALEAPKLHYKDYVVWNAEQMQAERAHLQKEFWKDTLSGNLPVVELPYDYSRPAVLDNTGAVSHFHIDRTMLDQLNQLAKTEGTSLYAVLMAAFNIMLSRLSGSEDILIGSPVAGRRHHDLKEIVGLFINTLVFRNQPMATLTAREFIKQVGENSIKALDHQDFLYEDLIDELNITRNTSRNPLFDIMFVLQNMKHEQIELPGVQLQPQPIASMQAKFDLTLMVFENENGLDANWEYATALFKPETINRFTGYFITVLEALIEQVDSPLQALPLLPKGEYEYLVTELNSTEEDYDGSVLVHQHIERQAAKTPERIAVKQGDKTLSYRQLNEQANALAHHLIDLGVCTNMMVGICLEKSVETAIATLAVLKAGGAYLPLDSEYPVERLNYMLQDAEASILITTGTLVNLFATMNCEVVDLNQYQATKQIQNPNLPVAPNHLIYSIYTSGSTGKPKGTLVYHKGFLNLMQWYLEAFDFDENNNFLLISSTSFDLTQKNIFAPLMRGGSLCLPESKYYDPELLSAEIARDRITNINCTPSAFYLLTDGADENRYKQLAPLEYVFLGGEPIHPDRIAHWELNEHNKAKVVNSYGPTECSDVVAYHVIDDINKAFVPVGKGICNTELYVLDQNHNLLPFGMEGELYIGGAGVGAGYKGKPELTAQKFIDNPFGDGKIYGTGDLVKWLDDGNGGGDIGFVGRIDHQVKIRGYRIELGEIDQQLGKHPNINESLVVALEANGTKYLCGYYTADKALPEAELRNKLIAHLPEYMVPSHFVYLEAFPLTPNGKIDRHSLPKPAQQVQEITAEFVAPDIPEAQALVEVMEVVLAKAPIGLQDHFFSIGGDSIKSIQIVSKLKAKGYQIAVKDIFQHPVLGDMANYIQSGGQEIDQSVVTGNVGLTPIQQWFFDENNNDEHHFNQSVFLKSETPIDKVQLEQALYRIMEHHDQLRAQFKQIDARVVQDITLEIPVITVVEEDLRDKGDDIHIISSYTKALQQSFVLEEGPLLKAGLFHTSEGSHLLLVAHHLIIDGVSWRILLEDLLLLLQDAKTDLPMKSHAFQYWSKKLKDYNATVLETEEVGYWNEVVQQVEALSALPQDFENEDNLMKDVEKMSVTLEVNETTALLGPVNKAYNTTINDVLLTGLGRAIKNVFKTSEIGIRLEGHGREEIESGIDVSRTIGWFTTIYPVVLDVSNDDLGVQIKTNKEVLHHVPHNGIGFGALNATVNAPILFNYLGQFDMASEVAGMELSQYDAGKSISPNRKRDCQLEVVAAVKNGQLNLQIEYNTKQYKEDTILALLTQYEEALLAIKSACEKVEEPEFTPSDFIYKGLTQVQLDTLLGQYDVAQILGLTPMQEGMLFHSLSGAESETYFQQFGYRVQWQLNTELVAACLEELMLRHEMLRTAFVMEGLEVPVQVVLKQREIPSELIDISHFSVEEQEEKIKNWKAQDVKQSFDMANGALMRFTIFDLGKDQYEIVWSYHHILMDGWCLSLIMSDFKTIYEALNSGQAIKLPPITSFGDYILWLEKQQQQRSFNYWEQYLEGYDKVAELPQRKGYESGYERKEYKFELDANLVGKINKVAAQYNVTPSTMIQAFWSVTLAKYNNTNDVVFGAVTSGRQADVAGIETTIGLFINTIPVRAQFDEKSSFVDLIEGLQTQVLESQQHDYCSLASIQQRSELKHSLLNHIMVFENFPVGEQMTALFRGDSKEERLLHIEAAEQTNYDFNIMVVPGETYAFNFSYNSKVYDPKVVVRLATHFQYVISQATSLPTATIKDIQLTTIEEYRGMIATHNATQRDYDSTLTLVDLLEQQVTQAPEAMALVVNGETYTYNELNSKANQLAHYLIEKGVQPEMLVGLLTDRSEDLIIGMLAITKAGGTYVPIDPKFPSSRINYMLEHSEMKLVVTDRDLDSAIATIKIREAAIDKQAIENIGLKIDANTAAYMIYTSGSTGVPKGIEIVHKAVNNFILGVTDVIPINASDKVLSVTTASFDIFVLESWLPLCMGATVVLANDEEVENANVLSKLITTTGATLIQTTPSRYQYLLDTEVMETSWQQLEKILVGGEAFPQDVLERLQDKTDARIFNMYGPTETTVWSAIKEVTEASTITIGHPIANTQLLILDRHQNPVPQGVVGELYIAGDGLALGYFKNDTLTKERFITNTYVIEADAALGSNTKLYHTGDLARLNEAGEFECLGRVDDQVKIHGYRIELGEIETAVNSMQGIKQSVALASGLHTDKQLLLYYVADTTTALQFNDTEANADRIGYWEAIWDNSYAESNPDDSTFNIAGWGNSYTKGDIPAEEMREWVDDTICFIIDHSPKHLFEIGCGTGLLLYGLLESCDSYVGIDMSPSTITNLTADFETKGIANAKVLCAKADDYELPNDQIIDTVLINSVVQYFPNEVYLETVIARAINSITTETGQVIIGDVRNLALHEEFYHAILKEQLPSDTRLAEFSALIYQQKRLEKELLIDPRYFLRMLESEEEVVDVSIQLKASSYENEMSLFRYNVVLHIDKNPTQNGIPNYDVFAYQWKAEDSIADINRVTEESTSGIIHIQNIPNAYLSQERNLSELKVLVEGGSNKTLSSIVYDSNGIRLDDAWNIVTSLGYQAAVTYNEENPRHFDILINKGESQLSFAQIKSFDSNLGVHDLVNNPMQEDDDAQLAKHIKEQLSDRLPQYMIPSVMTRLEALPQTPNGKVDKKALLALEVAHKITAAYVAPVTATEMQLVTIWQELLEVDKIGVHDNFFDLGGHSLKAMYLLNYIQKEFGATIKIKTIFEQPTIQELGIYIYDQSEGANYEAIPVATSQEYYPLSAAQQRLYFLYEFDKASVAYNMPLVLEIEGNPDIAKIESAIQHLIHRQASLRTNFKVVDGSPVQFVQSTLDFTLIVEEITEEAIEARVAQFVQPFDLENDALLRVRLLQASKEQYYLLLDIHHIIADGTTHGVIVKEFMSLYQGLKVPSLKVQYTDYAVWQQSDSYQNKIAKQRNYWEQLYVNDIPVLELPTDYVRPAIQQFEGSSTSFSLSVEQTKAMNSLVREQEVSQFMVLFGAYAILLSKLSGQEDIVIGAPVAGRNHADLADIAGMFVNTLALRTLPKSNLGFDGYLEQLKSNVLEAFDHQEFPFEALVDTIDLPKDTSRNPLFNVMFVLQNMDIEEMVIEELRFKPFGLDEGISKFDITLTAQEKQGQVHFNFEYATSLFTSETITRFVSYFKVILQSIIQDATIEIGDISLLTETDKKQINGFNQTALEYASTKTVHELIEEQVGLRGNQPALYFKEEQLSYDQYNQKANQLARYLVNKGISSGDNVALFMDRSTEFMIGVLAIMKAGAAFLPINPRTPKDRVDFMLKDSAVPYMLIHEIEEVSFDVGIIDFKDSEAWSGLETSNLEVVKRIDESIAILYTSGTTGNPKGVQLPHRTFVNLIAFMQDTGIECEQKMVLQFAELSFDATYQEMFACFIMGGTMAILEESKKRNPDELVKLLNEYQVNVMVLPTGFFKSITASDLYVNQFPTSIEHIITAGEALKVSDELKDYITNSNATLHNHYGPTETHVVTALPMDGLEVIATNPTIGTPISNTEILILDARNRKQPIGVPGELCIGGDSLAMCYLNRPDLTAEKFAPHPFIEGARIYRTGDIASWNTDGTIKFIGRADHQVKIRGFRIELEEIEASLLKIKGINQVAVLALGEAGQKYLCAYYTTEEVIAAQALKAQLHQVLPEYMVPQYFVFLEAFPITKNGKLDRKQLPKPSLNTASERYQAPSTPTEEQLVAVWSDLLGVDNIGVNDHFFELGGHSLLAIKLIDQIKTKMGQQVAVSALFKQPTIALLAAEIDKGNIEYKPVVALQSHGDEQRLFCVPPAAGTPFNFYDLAHAITDRPVYAFHASGLEEGQVIHGTVQEIAAFYIEAMKTVQPEGPYLLAGWSLGGIIAFEMVKQLEANGDGVNQLIVLDTQTHIQGENMTDRDMEMYLIEQQILLAPVRESLKIATWKEVQENAKVLHDENEWLKYLMSKFNDFNIEFGEDIAAVKRFLDVWKTQNRAGAYYELTQYDGQVTLVKAEDIQPNVKVTNAYGWDQFISGKLNICTSPGNHISMLKAPNVIALGATIMNELEKTTIEK